MKTKHLVDFEVVFKLEYIYELEPTSIGIHRDVMNTQAPVVFKDLLQDGNFKIRILDKREVENE